VAEREATATEKAKTPPPPETPGADWPEMAQKPADPQMGGVPQSQGVPLIGTPDVMIGIARALESLAEGQKQIGELLAGKFAGVPAVPAEMATQATLLPPPTFAEKIPGVNISFGLEGNRILVGEIKMGPRGPYRPVERVHDNPASKADFLRRGNTTVLSPHGCRLRVIETEQQFPRLYPWPSWNLLPGHGAGPGTVLEDHRIVSEQQMATMAGGEGLAEGAF